MRTQSAVIVVGASAALLTAGIVAAPDAGDAITPAAEPTDGSGTSGASEEPTAAATAEPGGDAQAPEADAGAEGADGGVTGTFDGPVVSNIRGDYQVSLTFEDGVLVAVDFPVAGTDAPESRMVNERALPVLEEELLEAQHWDVEYVSGASFTSPAMVESAEGAFEDAGL